MKGSMLFYSGYLLEWEVSPSYRKKNFLCVAVFIPLPLFLGDRCDWRSGKAAHSLNHSQRNTHTHRQCAHTVGFWLQASLTTAQLPLFQGTPQHAAFLSPSLIMHMQLPLPQFLHQSLSLFQTHKQTLRNILSFIISLFSFVKYVITKILGNNPLHLN